MTKRKKLKDLANHLGLSEATVSLALNNREGVSSSTKEKVIRTAKEFGYTPNYFARGLATQKSGMIGLIIPEIDNPFYSRLTQIMDEVVRHIGYNLVLGFSHFDLEAEQQAIDRFLRMSVEGIVISPVHCFSTSNEYRKMALSHKVPLIYLGAHYDFDCHYVMTDLAKGSEQLTNHLLSQGIRDICFITGPEDIILASHRERGFRQAHLINSVTVRENQFIRCKNFNYEEACRIVTELLSKNGSKKPQAIITVNDIMALGVMRTVRRLGYKIPDDIMVAGYDNVMYSEIAEVALTTVHQPVEELVVMTIQELLKLIIEPIHDRWVQIQLDPKLVIRESTTPVNMKYKGN